MIFDTLPVCLPRSPEGWWSLCPTRELSSCLPGRPQLTLQRYKYKRKHLFWKYYWVDSALIYWSLYYYCCWYFISLFLFWICHDVEPKGLRTIKINLSILYMSLKLHWIIQTYYYENPFGIKVLWSDKLTIKFLSYKMFFFLMFLRSLTELHLFNTTAVLFLDWLVVKCQ